MLDDVLEAPPDAVRTRSCSFWIDGFLHARFHDGAEVTAADARENLAASWTLNGEKAGPVLVDLRRIRSQSAEARAVLAGPEATPVCNVVALIIGSPISRVIGNFFLGFNRPAAPTRLFTSVEDARAWVYEMRAMTNV